MSPAGAESPSGTELLGLGALVAAAVVVPLVAGLALDSALRTGPLLLFVGLALGVALATAAVYVRFRKYL